MGFRVTISIQRYLKVMTFIKLGKSKEEELDDKELVRRIVHEGEKEHLETIYEKYIDRIFRKCMTLTKDHDLAKDLTHDIMVKVLLNLSKFKGTAPFSLWVHSITYNFCMDYFRKQKKIPLAKYEEKHLENLPGDQSETIHQQLKELRLTELEEHFKHLRKEEQMILLMRYQDGMSIKQMAATLGLKEGAVKMRLKRSREHLSKSLKENNHET